MALTDTAIKKAPPKDKQYRMPDEKGLVLLVRTNGSKLWQLRFRHDGKEKTASLGQYPEVSLAAARIKRDDARKLVAAGRDPVAVKRAERTARLIAAENSFETVSREWWAHWKHARSSDQPAPRRSSHLPRQRVGMKNGKRSDIDRHQMHGRACGVTYPRFRLNGVEAVRLWVSFQPRLAIFFCY